MVRLLLFSISFLLSLTALQDAEAQIAVNAGRKFAFGIPEGPDRQVDSTQRVSRLFLTFMGSADGCAAVKGPDGFTTTVNFSGTRQREIELPLSYMQKWDEGFNKKGFVVETTQPVHLELHVVFPGASESTQIFPMDMLDGDYLLSGWKLWNDTLYDESNRAQFLITAAEDNTQIAITAPHGILPNVAPGSTVNIMLNAGECYIGKMDTTLNTDLTTSQVIVKANKPVNIMQANTCGYVPYAVQSCNMLFDNVLPRKYFDTKFYVQPISREVRSDHILLTSETDNFGAITSDGIFFQTSDGRLDIIVDKPTMIETDAPVMCQLLMPGSAQAELGLGDPSWVTIAPMSLWDDTLIWYAPPTVGGTTEAFAHYITVTGPQSAFNDIMIDDRYLRDFGTMNAISGTTFFTSQVGVPQGAHKLKSAVPVGGVINGIAPSDAYAFLPGGTLPGRYHPVPEANINMTASEALLCKELTAELTNTLTLSAQDQIVDLVSVVTYDPAVLRVVSATPGSFFAGVAGVTVDVSTPGELRVSHSPSTYITGDGTLIDAVFAVEGDVTSSTLNGQLTLVTDEVCDNTRTFDVELPITITKVFEQGTASITLGDLSGGQSEVASAVLQVSDLATDAEVREFDVTLIWDHDLLVFDNVDASGMQAEGWSITPIEESPTRLRLHFTAPEGIYLTNGSLARLNFKVFLSDTTSTDILVLASLPSARKCPLELTVPQSSATFDARLFCGEDLVIAAMAGKLRTARVSPNPASRSVVLEFDHAAEGSAVLYDALGRPLMTWPLSGSLETQLELPATAGSGIHTLTIRSDGFIKNLPLIIQK